MKEIRFIQENKSKWERFEKLSGQDKSNADELASLYIDITNDLSYAQTKYPKRAVRVYLNQLARKVFNSVYKKKKQPIRFWKFWKITLPLELYKARKNILISLVIFSVAALIGIVSQEYDHSFARIILSDYYVEMTEANIAKNDPLAVYNSSGETFSFLRITQNNIQVAFFTFVLGIFFSIGTYYILLINGIMVGAFQWFFKTKGLLISSFLGIWIHGAFEISSIVIAGGAGITMGNGLLFPGTLTRMQSLIMSAKRGLRIMLGLMPFIITAGFFESFITRHYLVIPDVIKWLIIFASFGTMLFYFGIYPFIVHRKWGEDLAIEEKPVNTIEKKISFQRINSVSNIVADGFYYYRKYLFTFFRHALPVAGIILIANILWAYHDYSSYMNFDMYWYHNFSFIFGTGEFFHTVRFFLYALAFSILAHGVFCQFENPIRISFVSFYKGLFYRLPFIMTIVLFWMVVFWFLPLWSYFFLILLLPFFMYILPSLYFDKNSLISNFFNGMGKGAVQWSKNMGLIVVLFVIVVVFFQLFAGLAIGPEYKDVEVPDLLDTLIVPLIKMHTSALTFEYWSIISLVKSFFFMAFILFILPLIFICIGFGFFSAKEYQSSEGLISEFEKFGKRNKTREDFT